MLAGAVGICGTMLVLPSLYQGSPASIIAIEDFLQGAYAMYLALPANISALVIIAKAFLAIPLASFGPNDANGMAKKALAMMTSTEMLAGSAKYIAYAPWRKSSIGIMEKGEPWYKDGKTNMVPQMPTAPANTKNYFLVDPIFWADNGTELGEKWEAMKACLLYTSPSPRDKRQTRMPSSA